MTLDRLWQLDSTNAASNSNYGGAAVSENCAPSGINNALRALGVMVARDLAFQASAISSSVSTNIVTSSTGLYVPITGANAINSFGVVPNEQPSAAVFRFLEFSSSASLSHGGSIFLPGGESIRTQPGDVMGVIHEGSADQWRALFYSRADGGLPMNSLSVTTITNRSMSTSAISTVTLNAASASITTIGITALNSLNSVSASVGKFTLATIAGAGVHGPLIHIRDEKASGTNGGSAVADTWTKHTLDDVKTNEVSGASTASSVLTLPVGVYWLNGWAVFHGSESKVRWRNTTDGATTLVGGNVYGNTGGDFAQVPSPIAGRFTVSTSAKDFELQYWCQDANTTDGLGKAATSGEVEVYAEVFIWKLA